ncbi:MAG: hypothetical protein ACH255_19495 [Candidatus Thiodiazotropha sp.]
MNNDEVYASVHNLDVREAVRRFKPKYSVLIVSPEEGVIKIEKYKLVPEFTEIELLLKGCKGCGAFVASAEMYPTKEELSNRINAMIIKLKKKRNKSTGTPNN